MRAVAPAVVTPAGPSCIDDLTGVRAIVTRPRRPYILACGVVAVAYSWLLWGFFSLLIFGQALGVAMTRVTSHLHLFFGRDLALGLYQVVGTSDAPLTDRCFACELHGRVYKPVQIQAALDSPTAIVVDTSDTAINGYRLVTRTELAINAAVMIEYANTCTVIASTMDAIFDRCSELGYNVTRDALRIVTTDASGSTVMKLLPDTLPVVAMPFSDNSLYGRYALPGWDGSACMVRLNGAYETRGLVDITLRGVNRSVREQKTGELLKRPGGVWRNGWYEDPQGSRWYSDVMTTDATPLGITTREFDLVANTELDCVGTNECGKMYRIVSWGDKIHAIDDPRPYTSVTIMNDAQYGLFLFKATVARWIESVYDLDMILANVSLGALLLRWGVVLFALLRSYRSGGIELQSASIGVLACARGFHWLPVFLLPRLKMNLAVFASIGITFDGSQLALAQAWFIIYPGIAELLFFVYSLLNLAAKLLRRRMSDALFGPTLLFFCATHYFRVPLAQSGWLEYDGRIATMITSDHFERLSVLDLLRGDTLLKLSGGIRSLFALKVAVLSLNVLPLLLSKATTGSIAPSRSGAERTLALDLVASGGLGVLRNAAPAAAAASSSQPFRKVPSQSQAETASARTLSSYELLRLGFIVVSDVWLVSMSDWLLLALTAPARRLPALCVMVFEVTPVSDTPGAFVSAAGCCCCCIVKERPHLMRVNDTRLADCRVWAISAPALQ